ncbi:MAG: hypothetical protein U9P71_09020 [Campylobacterota bacterium]|nr:hypothetical protein [Campylobacterota bacterium]
MSLKENIDMVKDELNSEEKFFENAVKAERVWKKYKTVIIGGVIAVVAVVAISAINDANVEAAAQDSNAAYATLLKGPDSAAEKELAALNPSLFNALKFSNAVTSGDVESLQALSVSDDDVISDLATYELAVINADEKALASYTSKQNAIYKDLAILENSLLLMKSDQNQKAQQKLSLISEDSPLYKVAKSLMHYGVK